MRQNRLVYNFINLFFLLISLFFIHYSGILYIGFSISTILLLFLLIFLIHILKFFKLYFVVLEEHIPIRRMIKLYIKSTFVSILLPFKVGELYKFYLLGYDINNYSKSAIAIIIDKFFDAIVLCVLFIGSSFVFHSFLSILAWILLILLVLCTSIYVLFPGTYEYLNRFFIGSKQSQNNLFALRLLETINEFYLKAKDMIRGRGLVLITLTCLYWICESIFIMIITKMQDTKIGFLNVISYINDSFLGIQNQVFSIYVYLCVFAFLIILLFIYTKKFFGGYNEKGNNNL